MSAKEAAGQRGEQLIQIILDRHLPGLGGCANVHVDLLSWISGPGPEDSSDASPLTGLLRTCHNADPLADR
jgi:hypothetical protein